MKKRRSKMSPRSLPAHHYLTQHLRDDAFDTIMIDVRKNQKPHQQRTSRVLHQKSIERVLDVLANTLCRPKGIVVGGATALVLGIMLYAFTRYYGLVLPSATLPVLFATGYIATCCVEAVSLTLRHRH